MQENAKNKIAAAFYIIMWFVSYYFALVIGNGGLKYIFSNPSLKDVVDYFGFFLSFLIPVVPLWRALFYSKKIFSSNLLSKILITLMALGGIFIFLVISTPRSREHYDNIGFALGMVIATISIFFIITQLLFGLIYLKFQDQEDKKQKPNFIKATLFSFGLYLFFPVLLTSFLIRSDFGAKNLICSGVGGGYSAQINFLEPITKAEVEKIVKDNDFRIYQMTLANKNNLSIHYKFYFNNGLLDEDQKITILDSKTIHDKLLNHLRHQYYSNPLDPKQEFFYKLLDEYDSDQPVVWFLYFHEPSVEKLTKLVHRLDVNEHRLGVEINGYAGDAGEDPRYFQKPSASNPIFLSQCYDSVLDNK